MSSGNSNNQTDAFGLSPLAVVNQQKTTLTVLPSSNGQSFVNDDYDFARDQMREALRTVMEALQDAAVVASQSGEANSFLAVAQIGKTIVDGNEKLLKLSETHAKVTGASTDTPEAPTYQQNIYMTTDEMLEKMMNAKKTNNE